VSPVPDFDSVAGRLRTLREAAGLSVSELARRAGMARQAVHSIETGRILWSFLTRDHIYASTALLADGTVILPSADGTVYALDPLTGEQIWAYDHGAPLRSSPAVDGLDQIYLGSGDGRILVLNGDGTRRFSFDVIEPDRDDINSSPALGAHAVYVGSESGDIVAMPYDYCLRADLVDERCDVGASEPLADDIATVLYTTRFGTTAEPDEDVAPNQALAFTLVVREDGDTVLGLLNDSDLFVTVTPEQTSRFIVSAANLNLAGLGRLIRRGFQPLEHRLDGRACVGANNALICQDGQPSRQILNALVR
jgi:DNA-binding XRE family transcriptional regulator